MMVGEELLVRVVVSVVPSEDGLRVLLLLLRSL